MCWYDTGGGGDLAAMKGPGGGLGVGRGTRKSLLHPQFNEYIVITKSILWTNCETKNINIVNKI